MSITRLKIENLSKQYRLGQVGTGTLSHDLNRFWHKISGKKDPYSLVGAENDRSKETNSEYVWALEDINLEVKEGEVKDKWFEDNMSSFKYYGRDMETLFSKVKIAHSRRVFCKPKEEKTKIILKDLEKGLKVYLDNGGDDEEEKEKKKFENELRGRMYM